MATATSTKPEFAEVSNRQLGINDHYFVYKEVRGISAKWERFTQSLHLTQDTISIIEKDHGKKCEDCLWEGLERWLKRENYDCREYGIPSWRLVCIAVKETGDAALADKIAHAHPQPASAGVTSRIYVSFERNFELVKKLFELQLAFSDALDETKISFNKTLLPDVIDYLENRIFALLGPQRGKSPEAEIAIEELQYNVKTFSDLFRILQLKYLSWFNYDLIILLVKKFLPANKTLKRTWSCYEKKIKDYFKTSGVIVKDAEDVQFGENNSPPPGTKIMVARVDNDSYTLDDLFFLRKKLPKELNVPEYNLYFSFVYTSSLYLEYWIPDFVYSSIFPLSKEQKVGLADLGIAEMLDGDGNYLYRLNEFKTSEKSHHSTSDNACFDREVQPIEKPMATSHLLVSMESTQKIMDDDDDDDDGSQQPPAPPSMPLPSSDDSSFEYEQPQDEGDGSSNLDKDDAQLRVETGSVTFDQTDYENFENGFRNIIELKHQPITTNIKLDLSGKDMRDIIFNEMVPCNFFFTTLLSLPRTKISDLMRNFLKSALYTIPDSFDISSIFKNNGRNLSMYNVALLMRPQSNNNYLWFGLTEFLKGTLWCGSAVFRKAIICKYDIKMSLNNAPNNSFGEEVLDTLLNDVYQNVMKITQLDNNELQQIVSLGAIHMNILDISKINNLGGAKEFVNLISQHLNYNLGIIDLSIDDINELNTCSFTLMFQESKILCIIRQAVEIQSQSSKVPIKFIITCSEEDTKDCRDKAKRILLKAITKETNRLGLQPLQVSILVLDPSSADDLRKLNTALDMELPLARRYIKLSWLFLRDALNNMNDIVIFYDKLKDIAGKLNIQEMELKEFLETFTKFMSILYLPGIKSLEKVVILRPVKFINTISSLFKMPGGKNFDGVYTMEQLKRMIPNKELLAAVTKALCSVGLAIKTTSGKVNIRTSEIRDLKAPLLFVPLARSGQVFEKCHVTSLFIVFNSKLCQPDCQSFFISELLTLKGSSLLSGSDYDYHPNVFKILLVILRQDYHFSIIFRGTSIDVVMENYGDSSDIFTTIILCCKEALSKMSSIHKKFSYKLALSCLTPGPAFTADGYIDPAKRIFDDLLPNTKLCCHCEKSESPLRKKWKEAIQKIYENEEKRKERVNVEKLIELAQSLGSVIKSTQTLRNLASQLRVRVDQEYIVVLSKSCLPWQRVLMIFLMWEKKEEATKETLKSVLIRLGYPTVLLE